MTSKTIFFSYSRTDSEFVLQLAKDLRDAGAEIWLDQLDIKPGTRWDSSVEMALKESTRLLVILSPEAVNSNNVMDEVSYALENGKTVFPVLFRECDTPFRLRRVQRIDFTGDYQTALKKLLEVLGYGTKGLTNVENHKEEDNENQNIENNKTSDSESSANDESENALWEQAKSKNTISAYQKYLDDSEVGLYKENAVQIIKQIQQEQKVKDLENLLWEKTKAQNTLDAYNQYLKEFPEGLHFTSAQDAIKDIEKSKKEESFPKDEQTKNDPVVKEKTTKSKKMTLIVGGIFIVVVAAIVLFIIVGNNNNKKKLESQIQQEEMKRDSIARKAVRDSIRQDSIDNVQAMIMDSLRRDSIGLGKIFRGGIIFEIDTTGEHGTMISASDLNNGEAIDWEGAKKICAELNSENSEYKWALPTLDQLKKIAELNQELSDAIKLNKSRYWSSDPRGNLMQGYDFTGTYPYRFESNKNSPYYVRAVRRF